MLMASIKTKGLTEVTNPVSHPREFLTLPGMDVKQPDDSLVMVLSAPSGTGKTTLSRLLIQHLPNIKRGITYTTRPQRDDEKQDIDYHFVTVEEFQQRAQQEDFLECGKIYDYFYGTSLTSLQQTMCQGDDVVLTLDVRGAMHLKQRWRHCVWVFLIPPSLQELQARLKLRGTDAPHQILHRLRSAQSEIPFGLAHCDYLVVNTCVHRALEDLKAIVQAHRLKHRDREIWMRQLVVK